MFYAALHTRLAVALLALLTLTGGLGIGAALLSVRVHRLETEQQLSQDLAEHIVAMKRAELIAADGEIEPGRLEPLFHWLMVVNPRLECYLLDHQGRVVAYDPALGELARRVVSLEPISRMLEGPERLPLLGDDPRSPDRRKIFTAARLTPDLPRTGYLYIVLDSEEVVSLGERLRTSSVLRLILISGLVYLLLAAVAWGLLFRRLTRPLRRLTERMRRSAEMGKDPPMADPAQAVDEVALLEAAFERMDRRLNEQIRHVERIETTRRELIAHVSHDLRTPLAALRGYLDTLILKNGALSADERNEYLGIALRHSERLSKLVDELFELSKLESHEIEIEKEPFSIAELVQDNVQRYQIQATGRRVRLEAEHPPELPLVVADLGLIERVLQNLLENALRFTPERGSVVVRLEREPPNGHVVVQVADTGCGIPENEQKHIFERYYKVKRPIRIDGGSGLGLAITKRILDLHQSEIRVASEPGRGTVFSFTLAVAGEEASRPEGNFPAFLGP